MNGAYIGKLMEIAAKDHNVVHLLADSGTGYDEMFRRNFPDQIYNFGIAEQNMVSAAAGMATAGKTPFVFTAGAFLAYRSMEFIRDDVCFQNLNVKIVGMGSGLSWSSLGPTHHTTEDISVLRALPNLMILSPATPNQTAACVLRAYNYNGPVYIKIGMNKEKEFYQDNCEIDELGMDVVRDGTDCSVFVTGSILEEVVEAADNLEQEGFSLKVINVVSVKPFNQLAAIHYMIDDKPVFTVEEHNIHGGLGSILAETVSYNGLNKRIIPVGLNDCFAEGYGTHKSVRLSNHLDSVSIAGVIREHIDDNERILI